jgi:M-phase inducer tyrosine phosphatase
MTPPIPSSSPYFDSMDISPLPHKLPHFVAQITLPSPTPDCMDFPLLDPTETPNMLPVQPPPFLQLPEYVFIVALSYFLFLYSDMPC